MNKSSAERQQSWLKGEVTNPMEPLPYFYTTEADQSIRRRYIEAIGKSIPSEADAEFRQAHASVADVNLTNRLKHISRNTDLPERSDIEYEFVRLNWHDHEDFEDRMAAFAGSDSLPSLEIVTDLQAGQEPRVITSTLAEKAFSLVADFKGMEIVENDARHRVKVTRTLSVGDTKAAVVTAKTDQLALKRRDGQIIDVKTRQSGFVLLDDELEDDEREALRILGDMQWGYPITEDLVSPFRETVGQVLSEKDVFHPTLCTLFLARRIKRD